MGEKQPTLQLDDDPDFDQRQARVQRAAWAVCLVILLLGLLGLLGKGLLSDATATSNVGTLRIDYERIERRYSPTSLVIEANVPASTEFGLVLPVEYLEDLEIESVVPEPESVEIAGDNLVYRFTRAADSSLVTVTFNFQHSEMGVKQAVIGIAGGEHVEIRQVVLP